MSKNVEALESLKEAAHCNLKTEKVRCRTFKKGQYKGQTKCYCYNIPFSKELMRIRIFEPDERLWYYMFKCGDSYCIADSKAPGTQMLFTLNYGGYGKVEKIAFARGMPRMFKYNAGDKIKSDQLRSQNIEVNYGAMGVMPSLIDNFEAIWRNLVEIEGVPGKEEEEKNAKEQMRAIQMQLIEKFLNSHYKDYAIKQIENEWGVTLTEFNVIPKDKDFEAVFTCSGACQLK